MTNSTPALASAATPRANPLVVGDPSGLLDLSHEEPLLPHHLHHLGLFAPGPVPGAILQFPNEPNQPFAHGYQE
jgi:hypothetical protein